MFLSYVKMRLESIARVTPVLPTGFLPAFHPVPTGTERTASVQCPKCCGHGAVGSAFRDRTAEMAVFHPVWADAHAFQSRDLRLWRLTFSSFQYIVKRSGQSLFRRLLFIIP